MSKTTFMVLCILCVNTTAYTQSLKEPNGLMRHQGSLFNTDNGMKMDAYQLSNLLDSHTFDIYRQARREYVASIPLWAMAGAGAATSLTFLFVGLHADMTFEQDPETPTHSASPYYYAISGITMGAALLPFIPALVLTLDSHKKLDNVAATYEKKNNSMTFNIGPTQHGVSAFIRF